MKLFPYLNVNGAFYLLMASTIFLSFCMKISTRDKKFYWSILRHARVLLQELVRPFDSTERFPVVFEHVASALAVKAETGIATRRQYRSFRGSGHNE